MPAQAIARVARSGTAFGDCVFDVSGAVVAKFTKKSTGGRFRELLVR